jgi:glycosyltransferase involved in cell wall biosynthesis
MSANVTIITATIEGREKLLERAVASVRTQTVMPRAHFVIPDLRRQGGAFIKNRLMRLVDTEYVIILDDDDVLLPQHIETLWENRHLADVIYSYSDGNTRYNRPFSSEDLLKDSIVSHTALFPVSLFREVGPFPLVAGYDWEFWKTALAAGRTFHSVPIVTWTYDLDESRPHESLGGFRWDGC